MFARVRVGLRLACVVLVKLHYCFVCRNDGGQHNLRSAAYEALMELIKNSPKVSFEKPACAQQQTTLL